MKKIKNKKKLLIIGGGVVILVVVAFLAVRGVSHLTSKSVDTSDGIAYIKAAEGENIKVIEQKINQLEKNSDDEGERSARDQFSSSVVMGDSIATGFEEYDVLNTSSVVAKTGVHLTELDDQIEKAKQLNPQVVFLSYGMNDVIKTNGDTAKFIKQYGKLIDTVKEEIPDAHIYVNSILPVQDNAIEEEPALENIAEYNTELEALCDKKQVGFIDNTDIVKASYYEDDGIHFKAAFYTVWAQYMAEVATL